MIKEAAVNRELLKETILKTHKANTSFLVNLNQSTKSLVLKVERNPHRLGHKRIQDRTFYSQPNGNTCDRRPLTETFGISGKNVSPCKLK